MKSAFVRFRMGDLAVSYRKASAVNYVLYHCGIPVISDFVVRNEGHSPVTPVVGFEIPGYGERWERRLGPILPGGKITVSGISPVLRYEILEGQEGKKNGRLDFYIDGRKARTDDIPILGFYEWPLASEFRASLAAFVQPSHPVVQHILLDSADRLGADASSYLFDPFRRAGWVGGTEGVNKALYDCLAREYRIRYAFEPPSYERDCQVIRPPHVIIPSVEKKAGVGTCIDLCLLFASCLESVRLQPLLIVVREGESFLHCLLGCWTDLSERFEPVVTDPGRLIDAIRKAKLLLLEATGVTGRAGKVLSFNESAGLACELLHEDRFLFAVDVAAARQTVAPLQFPFQPGAVEVIRRAEVIAREEGYATLETRHLFGSFLLYEGAEDPFMEQIFSYLAADRTFLLGIYRKISRAGIRTKGAIPRPTLNYRRVLEDARFVAGDEGRKFVEKKHLFYALLLSPSAFVDRFFREAGTSRGQARQMFQGKYSWTKKIPETLFEWTGDGEG